ncbi:MAG TPA: hypothetical protein GYA10_15350 [Alphaproteobacteria bacterium]|nr:hypothetical protein [Alphaproteobacteria bacterium]
MHAAFQALAALHAEATILFASTILLVVCFLIARVMNARQHIALAFACMPLFVVWAVQGAVL